MKKKKYMFVLFLVCCSLVNSKILAQNPSFVMDGSSVKWVNTGNVKVVVENMNIANNASDGVISGDGTFILKGSSPIIEGTSTTNFEDLTISVSGAVSLEVDLIVDGTLSMEDGNLDLGNKILTMKPTSSWTNASGSIDATNAKIVFKSPTFDVGVLSSPLVKDLEFDRSAGVSLTDDLEVTGDFILTDGTVDVENHILKLSGNLIYNDGSVDAEDGTIDFNNSGNWSLPSLFFAGNVKALKVSGSGGITLGAPLIITNSMDFSNGKIETTAVNLLELGSGVGNTADVNWSSTSNARIVGPVKRWYGTGTNQSAEKGIIPVGNEDFNRSVQINFNESSAGGYIIAEFKDGLPNENIYELPLVYSMNGSNRYIQNADKTGYWDITPYNSSGIAYGSLDNVPYKMRVRINNPDVVANGNNLPDPPSMRIIRAKGNPSSLDHQDWTIGNTDAIITAVTPPSNTNFDYVVEATLTGFSWFNVGGDNSTPLPVELITFSASCNDYGNRITWSTASEYNSSHFDLERSRDGSNWENIKQVQAAGFSNELLKYEFIDFNTNGGLMYYRLNQVDINGDSKLYGPVFANCDQQESFVMTLPNPSSSSFSLVLSQTDLVGKSTVEIKDSKGSTVYQNLINIEEGINQINFSEAFAPGIYYISVSNGKAKSKVIKHSVF